MYKSTVATVSETSKVTGIAAKAKNVGDTVFAYIGKKAKTVHNWLFGAMTFAACTMNAYATSDISTEYTIGDLSGLNAEGLILGLAFWLCRLIGISMLVFGIYGYVTARKDGEAESMNGAIGKLVSGIVLILMPSILQGIGIISIG